MKPLFSLLILLLSHILTAQTWDNIIENIDTTATIRLEGSDWNNTLIRNCSIHNTGSDKDGILLKEVKNVKIENCHIYNIDGIGGIRLSIAGNGTSDVTIENNIIHNAKGDGINAPQRSQNNPPSNQENLLIKDNTIYNTGLGFNTGHRHPIYCQAADFKIENNIIFGIRDGNGISVRSSGKISGNIISGKSKANKPAIRYYSDHFTGVSETLLIENNIIYNDSSDAHTLHIFDFVNLYQNSVSDLHIVKNFNIRFNTIISLHHKRYGIMVSDDYNQNGYKVTVEGNLVVNTKDLTQCISTPSNSTQLHNLLLDDLSNFSSETPPYDFHIKKEHPGVDYVGTESSNRPTYDIDGEMRTGKIDAGADEFNNNTSRINFLKNDFKYSIYPNPVALGRKIRVEGNQNIVEIKLFNNSGQVVLKKEFNAPSKIKILELPINTSGIYFIQLNRSTILPLIVSNK